MRKPVHSHHKHSHTPHDCSRDLEERAIRLGEYILEHEATVRAAAKVFGISKSTVHKDISTKLPELQPALYLQVKEIIERNKQERHIRGGLATKRKYEQQKQHKNPNSDARSCL